MGPHEVSAGCRNISGTKSATEGERDKTRLSSHFVWHLRGWTEFLDLLQRGRTMNNLLGTSGGSHAANCPGLPVHCSLTQYMMHCSGYELHMTVGSETSPR